MRSDIRYIAMSLLAAVIGAVLVYNGINNGSAAWVAGGLLFLTIGAGTMLLTLGSVLPGVLGNLLRRRFVGILILVIVAVALVATVLLGLSSPTP